MARELLRRGRTIHALVRDPGTPAARALASAGAVLVRGDLDDSESLDAALRGVHGVFSVQTFLTRRIRPTLTSLKSWLRTTGWTPPTPGSH